MNILTFDLEEWFVYQQYDKGPRDFYLPIIESYLDELLELLDRQELKATFFCLGMVGKEYPGIIKRIARKGHEIGCHSHKHQFVYEMDYARFLKDSKEAIDILEDITGHKVRGYRAPAFSITEKNKWALQVLGEVGIEYDCSIFPATRSFGGFPSFTKHEPTIIKYGNTIIKEFPINIANVWGMNIAYSGGGYFRLIPYWKIQKIMKKSDYVMSYFHIRDFDAHQKKVLSLRYFKSYYGISGAFDKLKKFICDFDFINVERANDEFDWEKAPVIEFID